MKTEKGKALEIRSNNTIMDLLLNKASNRDIIRAMANVTIGDVAGRYPAISALKKLHGDRVETVLAALVVDASGYFEHAITESQALDVAAEICAQYYYLSLEDVYLALSRLKTEQIYGRLTLNKVLNVTSRYAEERANLAAQRNLNEHLARKESRMNYDKPDSIDHDFEKFKKQYNAKASTLQTGKAD